MVEFCCAAICTWAFVCWKISDYSFNFCDCDVSAKVFYFLLAQFWKAVLFYESVHFIDINCWWYSLMILRICVLSVVISPFSFLTLLIWFFSLFFFMSLANGFSILFIPSKNQLLALLIFAMVSFVFFLRWFLP